MGVKSMPLHSPNPDSMLLEALLAIARAVSNKCTIAAIFAKKHTARLDMPGHREVMIVGFDVFALCSSSHLVPLIYDILLTKDSAAMICRRCSSTSNAKYGFLKGERRYRCNDCGFQFVPTTKRKSLRGYRIRHNHVYIAKVFSQGQVTLPVEIRRLLQVGGGDKVFFMHNESGEIIIGNPLKTATISPQAYLRKITINGQIVIPVKIRQQASIKAGNTTFFTHNESGEMVFGNASIWHS